jgi:hypothetical protein
VLIALSLPYSSDAGGHKAWRALPRAFFGDYLGDVPKLRIQSFAGQAGYSETKGFEITDAMVDAVARKPSESGVVMPECDDPGLLKRVTNRLLRSARLETFGKQTY